MFKSNTQSELVALDAAELSVVVGGLDLYPTNGNGAGEHTEGAYPIANDGLSLYPTSGG